MTELSNISKEMAEILMQEVGFEDRLIGVSMSGSTGNRESTLYSLKELHKLLHTDSFEALSSKGGGPSMCYVDIDKMLHWIGEIYGDKQLADAMAADMEKVNSPAKRFEVAEGLLEKRLKQCEQVLT